jgi:shikimate dehydrogenase
MRVLNLNAETKLTCLLGHPVKHSASPAIHNSSYRELGLNAVYLAFDVLRIDVAIEGLRELGAVGCNITIPHKEKVMELLDSLDERASLIGAVNVIKFGDELSGFNTDVDGVDYSLELLGIRSGESALILGAGGAARAVLASISGKFPKAYISSRDIGRVERLRELCLKLGIECIPLPWEARERALDRIELLVNATPLGTGGEGMPVDASKLSGIAVLDLVYNPPETELVRIARERGCRAIGGLKMLIRQAAVSERIWFGVEPDERVMEEAALRFLGGLHESSQGQRCDNSS